MVQKAPASTKVAQYLTWRSYVLKGVERSHTGIDILAGCFVNPLFTSFGIFVRS